MNGNENIVISSNKAVYLCIARSRNSTRVSVEHCAKFSHSKLENRWSNCDDIVRILYNFPLFFFLLWWASVYKHVNCMSPLKCFQNEHCSYLWTSEFWRTFLLKMSHLLTNGKYFAFMIYPKWQIFHVKCT